MELFAEIVMIAMFLTMMAGIAALTVAVCVYLIGRMRLSYRKRKAELFTPQFQVTPSRRAE